MLPFFACLQMCTGLGAAMCGRAVVRSSKGTGRPVAVYAPLQAARNPALWPEGGGGLHFIQGFGSRVLHVCSQRKRTGMRRRCPGLLMSIERAVQV